MAPLECARARLVTGLPRDMPPEQISSAMHHVTHFWWPQLCRSSRAPAVAELNMFDPAWYDADGLLDICNPAYGNILHSLGNAYAFVLKKSPDDDVKLYVVNWRVKRHPPGNVTEATLLMMRGYLDKDGKRRTKKYRLHSPATGWLDFSKELDELRAKRDGQDKAVAESDQGETDDKATDDKTITTKTPSNPITDLRTLLATTRIAVPTDHGALAHPSPKKLALTKNLQDALVDNPALRGETNEPCELVSEQDGYVIVDHFEYLKPSSTTTSPVSKTVAARLPTGNASTATDTSDNEFEAEWDDYVMVGEEDEEDEVVKHVLPYAYKYGKKKDAVKPVRKGWFAGWGGKKKGSKKEEKEKKKTE